MCQGKVRHFCRGVVDVSMAVGARLQRVCRRYSEPLTPAFEEPSVISTPVVTDRDISIMAPIALSRLVRCRGFVGVLLALSEAFRRRVVLSADLGARVIARAVPDRHVD